MSIILQALLPKLHLNRNTSRKIIFGPELFGGLGLPHPYTYQGLVKLSLFLGHVRLQDKTGILIKIALSHLQLISGYGTFIFNLPYDKYGKWINYGWLPSLWEFASYGSITVKT